MGLSLGEISLKNSHKYLGDLRYGVGERRWSLLLCWSTPPRSGGGGDYSPKGTSRLRQKMHKADYPPRNSDSLATDEEAHIQ